MRKKIFPAILAFVSLTSLQAQDTTKIHSLKISGSADVYYRYDFNNPQNGRHNNFTSFTKSQNSFELGMISVKAEQTLGKAGIVADIGFGKRADEFSYNDKGSGIAIKQLFFTYAPSAKVKFSIGSWATHIGYEMADAYLNKNYSMSYLFSFGPFFHTGLKGEYTIRKKTTIMLGLVNPYDLKNAGNLPKMVIAQLAKISSNENLKVFLNYQGGKISDSTRLIQGDIVINYAISSNLSLGYNGTLQSRQINSSGKWMDSKSWWGSALYLNDDLNDWLSFALRGEYFNDKQNALGMNTGIFETTLSSNFKIDNLTLIPEFRFENAGRKIYSKSNGDFIDCSGSFILAATYQF